WADSSAPRPIRASWWSWTIESSPSVMARRFSTPCPSARWKWSEEGPRASRVVGVGGRAGILPASRLEYQHAAATVRFLGRERSADSHVRAFPASDQVRADKAVRAYA